MATTVNGENLRRLRRMAIITVTATMVLVGLMALHFLGVDFGTAEEVVRQTELSECVVTTATTAECVVVVPIVILGG